ncbi:ribonuclease E [Burkholderia pseudomallei MSHR1043]|nr:ribonuclease E [Burkholderia pseudomallei MSHR1043]
MKICQHAGSLRSTIDRSMRLREGARVRARMRGLHRRRRARRARRSRRPLAHAGAREHRAEQHVRARLDVLGQRTLGCVVRQPADARNEHHRARHAAREMNRIVPGAAHDPLVRIAAAARGRLDELDARRIERRRRARPVPADVDRDAASPGDLRAYAAQLALDRVEPRIVGMAKIDAERDALGDRVARRVVDRALPDRRERVGRMARDERLDRERELGAREQRVLAVRHRRRAGMRGRTRDRRVEPADRLPARDDADRRAVPLQHRALLDMRLEVRIDALVQRRERRLQAARPVRAAHPRRAQRIAIAARFERFGKRDAVRIARGERRVERQCAGKHRRAEHRRREARALLVGPRYDLDRLAGDDPAIVQRAHELEPGEHAVRAVEAPPFGLRVEMTADEHGRLRVVRAGAPGEQVADRIDAHRHPRVATPLREAFAAAPVGLGQREPAHAAARGAADSREFRQAVPEPPTVNFPHRDLPPFPESAREHGVGDVGPPMAARVERDHAAERERREARIEHRERPPLPGEPVREPRADERRQPARDRAAHLVRDRDRRIAHARRERAAHEARDHRVETGEKHGRDRDADHHRREPPRLHEREHRIGRGHREQRGELEKACVAELAAEPRGDRLRHELDDRDDEQAIEDQRFRHAHMLRRERDHERVREIQPRDADRVRAQAEQQHRARRAQHLGERPRDGARHRLLMRELGRFVDLQPHEHADREQRDAREKRQPPAPGHERAVLHRRDRAKRDERQDQPGRAAQLRERSEERAPPIRRMLARHQHRAAPLAAHRDALHDAQQHEQHGREQADAFVGRQQTDADRRRAHQRERRHQRLLAADPVAEMAEEEPAERAREEADRERRERRHRARERIVRREEQLAEDERGRVRVDVEVVPLDHRADERGAGRAARLARRRARRDAPGQCVSPHSNVRPGRIVRIRQMGVLSRTGINRSNSKLLS